MVDLEHEVDPAYRSGASGFMMHDRAVAAIRKVKDGSGRPLFLPGFEINLTSARVPDRILGYPVFVNQHMPVPAANAKSILFGDFSKYLIRDVMAVEIRRFDDWAFAQFGQVGFCGWMRTGGDLLDVGGAVKAYRNSAT